MKTSSMTPFSKLVFLRSCASEFLPVYTFLLCLFAAPLLSGCGTILVTPFFPATGARGIVLDENGRPIPNAPMRADWNNRSLEFTVFPPLRWRYFRADENGEWRFYKRDAEFMYIGVYRWTYVGTVENLACIGPLKSGECITNAVVFRVNTKDLPSKNEEEKWNPGGF